MSRGFSSAGQTSEMNRIERMLQNHKGSKVTMGVGAPFEREGGIGDITVRTVVDGVRCYVKTTTGWQDVNTMVPSTQLEWHEMVLENSWVVLASSYYTPAYTKDANGFVHFRGVIKDGSTAAADITTLPEQFRPNKITLVPASVTTSSAGAMMKILSDGTVNIIYGGLVAGTSLDGISFYSGEIVIGTSTGGGGGGGPKGGGGSGGSGGGGAG